MIGQDDVLTLENFDGLLDVTRDLAILLQRFHGEVSEQIDKLRRFLSMMWELTPEEPENVHNFFPLSWRRVLLQCHNQSVRLPANRGRIALKQEFLNKVGQHSAIHVFVDLFDENRAQRNRFIVVVVKLALLALVGGGGL